MSGARSSIGLLGALLILRVARLASQQADTAAPVKVPAKAPFAFADFTWLNGNSRQNVSVLDSKYITGEFRLDVTYIYQLNHPSDHTLVGTSESGRTNEIPRP